jgi:hypothetical protein
MRTPQQWIQDIHNPNWGPITVRTIELIQADARLDGWKKGMDDAAVIARNARIVHLDNFAAKEAIYESIILAARDAKTSL